MKAQFTVLYPDGHSEIRLSTRGTLFDAVMAAIGCDICDTVNLRDGRVMLVDDVGHMKGLPLNEAATALYHSVCRPGTTNPIVGVAVIATDADFA